MVDHTMNDDEKVELLKKWWNKYGNWLSTVILLIVVGIVAWQFWHRHEQKVIGQASVVYQNMLDAVTKNDAKAATAQANTLFNDYNGSTYATMAAMLLAKQAVDAKKIPAAKEKLQWVIDKGRPELFRALAKLRLAGIMITEKKAQDALTLIKGTDSYFPTYFLAVSAQAEIALNNKTAAKKHYEAAIKALPEKSAMRKLLEMQKADL